MSYRIFFYSDPHYGHANIIKYCNRPYFSAEEMDKDMIIKYNSRVSAKDTVVWLGDCGFYHDKQRATELLNSLNGKKILVRGNHDRKPGWMLDIGFDFVVENMTMQIGKQRVRLSHYPYGLSILSRLKLLLRGKSDRYSSKRLSDKGDWLIHGHIHNNGPRVHNKSINVCVDVWDFYPVHIKEIIKIMSKGV